MINPINFRAVAGNVTLNKPAEAEGSKTENVTNPISTEASFKGANALAAYNKVFLAVDAENAEEAKAPAFKGEEPDVEDSENKAPAFKGEETDAAESKELAFKGENETEEVPVEVDAEAEKVKEEV